MRSKIVEKIPPIYRIISTVPLYCLWNNIPSLMTPLHLLIHTKMHTLCFTGTHVYAQMHTLCFTGTHVYAQMHTLRFTGTHVYAQMHTLRFTGTHVYAQMHTLRFTGTHVYAHSTLYWYSRVCTLYVLLVLTCILTCILKCTLTYIQQLPTPYSNLITWMPSSSVNSVLCLSNASHKSVSWKLLFNLLSFLMQNFVSYVYPTLSLVYLLIWSHLSSHWGRLVYSLHLVYMQIMTGSSSWRTNLSKLYFFKKIYKKSTRKKSMLSHKCM